MTEKAVHKVKNVKRIRGTLGVKHDALAIELGLASRQYIKKKTSNKTVTPPTGKWYTFKQAADFLNAPVYTLMYWCNLRLLTFYKPVKAIQLNEVHLNEFLERSRR